MIERAVGTNAFEMALPVSAKPSFRLNAAIAPISQISSAKFCNQNKIVYPNASIRTGRPLFETQKITLVSGGQRFRPLKSQRGDTSSHNGAGKPSKEKKGSRKARSDRNRSSSLYVDEWGEKAEPEDESSETKLSPADPSTLEDDEWGSEKRNPSVRYVDEWGEKTELEDASSQTTLSDADPANLDDDEWGSEKRNPSARYVDEWGEKTEPEDAWAQTRLSDAEPAKSDNEWGSEKRNPDVRNVDEWGEKTEPEDESSQTKLSSPDPSTVEDDEWSSEKKIPSVRYVDEWGEKTEPEDALAQTRLSDADPAKLDDDEWGSEKRNPSVRYVDEGGEKTEPEDASAQTRLSDADPPALDDDKWGNGAAAQAFEEDSELTELKKCLVGCFYGTDYGLRASSQTRAEISELIYQLEAKNPTPAPTEALSLLEGRWILLYTSFSELLPLIAAGTLPLVKLEKICQEINTNKFTVQNTATYVGPFASFSFRALATFDVGSPKRIEVKFEEGIIPPPEIKTNLGIPEKFDVFGQKIELNSLQGALRPLQEAATRISRVISGQPSLKFPLGSGAAESWLLTTYLDRDLRISRGDGGGLFVLTKEGSSLLDLLKY